MKLPWSKKEEEKEKIIKEPVKSEGESQKDFEFRRQVANIMNDPVASSIIMMLMSNPLIMGVIYQRGKEVFDESFKEIYTSEGKPVK